MSEYLIERMIRPEITYHHVWRKGDVLVIEGDQIKIVDEKASSLPDCPPLLGSLLGFDSPASWSSGMAEKFPASTSLSKPETKLLLFESKAGAAQFPLWAGPLGPLAHVLDHAWEIEDRAVS